MCAWEQVIYKPYVNVIIKLLIYCCIINTAIYSNEGHRHRSWIFPLILRFSWKFPVPRCLFTLVHVVLFLCFGPFFYEVSSSFVRCECVPFVYFPPFVEVFLKCVWEGVLLQPWIQPPNRIRIIEKILPTSSQMWGWWSFHTNLSTVVMMMIVLVLINGELCQTWTHFCEIWMSFSCLWRFQCCPSCL